MSAWDTGEDSGLLDGGPGRTDSEHPPALVSPGQSYMAGLVNASMQEPVALD